MVAALFAVVVALSAAPADDRLVLQAQNVWGQQGLVRTTSALMGGPTLGLSSRAFVSPDFILPDVADANTFLEGAVAAGVSFFDVVEFALQSRAAANLNTARAAVAASVGDLSLSAKGGMSFGPVAAGLTARLGLPTRANKVGFDLGNLSATFEGAGTFDLQAMGAPVRIHGNAGYRLQTARFSGDGADNPFFLDGADGGLLALSTQQWFFDAVHAGVGVEAPLPYVSPFVELWYQAALGAQDYDFLGDAWLIVTPGVRFGVGGVRVDVAADVGLLGNAGGLAPDAALLVDGQPLNPLWAARVGFSHAFDVGGGSDVLARVEGCVKDAAGPVEGAVVAVVIDGRPGPRLLTDDKGCFAAPLPAGVAQLSVSEPDHQDNTVAVTLVRGEVARADVTLAAQPRQARVAGFVTNKEDESIDVSLDVIDGSGNRISGTSVQGAFDLGVRPGRVVVIARGEGYLTQGVDLVVRPGERRTHTFVMRKVPKKRSATLQADRIDTAARVPFEFGKPRLQSTAEYLLDEIADLLLANPAIKLSIEVHTDIVEVADPTQAKELTEARARAVKDALVERGVDPDRLETRGYGITQPIGPNDAKNRRVEFLLVQ